MDRARVPVVVLCWDHWPAARRCLKALAKAGEPRAEPWLMDNGSRPPLAARARREFPGLRVLRSPRNKGWAGGNNAALELALKERRAFVYLLNDDALPRPGFLTAALDAAQRLPKAAAVGSVLVDRAGRALFDGAYHAPPVPAPKPGPAVVSRVASGAGMLLRLAALRAVGLFDERFFCYHEETEWCLRAADRGWRCAVAPRSVVEHEPAGSDRAGNALYYRARNRFLLVKLGRWLRPPMPGPEELARRLVAASVAAQAAGRRQEAKAFADAARDGLAGRFGPRPAALTPRRRQPIMGR